MPGVQINLYRNLTSSVAGAVAKNVMLDEKAAFVPGIASNCCTKLATIGMFLPPSVWVMSIVALSVCYGINNHIVKIYTDEMKAV